MRTTLHKRCALVAGAGLTALVCSSSPAFAQGYLGGNLTPFAIVGATTITCVGASVVSGDIGLSPGSSVTGFRRHVPTSARSTPPTRPRGWHRAISTIQLRHLAA